MKIAGRKIEGPSRKTVIIKREEGDLKFIFEAILDESEFFKTCPQPKAPLKMVPGGKQVPDNKNPDYLKALDDWSLRKTAWSFLKTISVTPNLEWETVDLANPDTWTNYQEELTKSGFTPIEQLRLLQAFIYVNGLDSLKVDDAVDSFLADPQETQEN